MAQELNSEDKPKLPAELEAQTEAAGPRISSLRLCSGAPNKET